MSKLQDQLREMRVFNTHGLLKHFALKGRDVAVVYHTAVPRQCSCNHSVVYSPSHKTSPDAPWYNNGCKSFVGQKSESVPLAIAWATEKYGITEWVTCPTDRSAKIPAEVLEAAKKAAKIAAQ